MRGYIKKELMEFALRGSKDPYIQGQLDKFSSVNKEVVNRKEVPCLFALRKSDLIYGRIKIKIEEIAEARGWRPVNGDSCLDYIYFNASGGISATFSLSVKEVRAFSEEHWLKLASIYFQEIGYVEGGGDISHMTWIVENGTMDNLEGDWFDLISVFRIYAEKQKNGEVMFDENRLDNFKDLLCKCSKFEGMSPKDEYIFSAGQTVSEAIALAESLDNLEVEQDASGVCRFLSLSSLNDIQTVEEAKDSLLKIFGVSDSDYIGLWIDLAAKGVYPVGELRDRLICAS